MQHTIILPQLAMGMSEGLILQWLAAEGARVKRDEPLVSIETEKVVTELPAPFSGFLHIIAKEGDKLAVETVIARIVDTLEEYSNLANAVVEPAPAATAKEQGVDLAPLTGPGSSGQIVQPNVSDTPGLNSALPTGGMRPASQTAFQGSTMREKARIPITGTRKTIADRMLRATTTAAQTFMFFEIDITDLAAWRAELLSREQAIGARISLTAIYAKAVASACKKVPICNATLTDDEIVLWDNVNIGIAVALPGQREFESSLVVPVIRDVDNKGIVEINQAIRDKVKAAREGRLAPGDVGEATITISSTDRFISAGAWMVSTPLLNLPQVANFQPGTPVERPLVIDGSIKIRTVLPCSFSFDHRAMDGQPAGQFLREISELLGEPKVMPL